MKPRMIQIIIHTKDGLKRQNAAFLCTESMTKIMCAFIRRSLSTKPL